MDKNNFDQAVLPADSVIDGALFAKMVKGGADNLRANVDAVNNLNVFPVPDGDTGDNMYMTIGGGVDAISDLRDADLSDVVEAFAHGMLLGARGNSGVILSQFFSGVAKGLSPYKQANAQIIAQSLQMGVEKAYKAVMTPTEGTILTVAREAVEYTVAHVDEYEDITELFSSLKEQMHSSLERTPELLSVLKEAGVVDSGGAGLLFIAEGFDKVLRGVEIESTADDRLLSAKKPAVSFAAFTADSEMVYGYCTELLLQLQHSKTDVFTFDQKIITDYLSTIGDSIVAVKDNTIVKIHVHTKTPEKVLEFCRRYGEFLTVKIENMSLQHSEVIAEQKAAEKKKYGMVSVCVGAGLKSAFKELGVDEIVDGGQTNNPSTADFIEAFDKISAEHIFVFPNNGNIYMAACQARDIYEKATVHVMESKNLGMGYVGAMAFDPESPSPELLKSQIEEAMAAISCGYISPAVRDANLNGVQITDGEFIGYVGKKIITSKPSKNIAALELAKHIFAEGDRYMLTVFCGLDADESDREELSALLSEHLPDVEVYFVDGGQDIHPYIFTAE